MKSLEDAIKEVKYLMNDVGYFEVVYFGYNKYTETSTKWSIKEWILHLPNPEEAKEEKRKVAIEKLQEICDHSDWYSARFTAAKVLCMPYEELKKKFTGWIEQLKNNRDKDIKEADEDLKYLYNLPSHIRLKKGEVEEKTYDANKEFRKEAGKALGYNKFGIWLYKIFIYPKSLITRPPFF